MSPIILVMTVVWLIFATLDPWLPATLGGWLILIFICLGLWKWSERPENETPTHSGSASTSSRRSPQSGTQVMPEVKLPAGYEPPSAAVWAPATSLMGCDGCGEPFSGPVTILWVDGKTYHQRCAR